MRLVLKKIKKPNVSERDGGKVGQIFDHFPNVILERSLSHIEYKEVINDSASFWYVYCQTVFDYINSCYS